MLNLKSFLRKHLSKPRIVCFIIGHKKAVSMLNEDEHCIYDKGCPRCKQPSIMTAMWKNSPPPKWISVEEWDAFKQNKFKELRASISESK